MHRAWQQGPPGLLGHREHSHGLLDVPPAEQVDSNPRIFATRLLGSAPHAVRASLGLHHCHHRPSSHQASPGTGHLLSALQSPHHPTEKHCKETERGEVFVQPEARDPGPGPLRCPLLGTIIAWNANTVATAAAALVSPAAWEGAESGLWEQEHAGWISAGKRPGSPSPAPHTKGTLWPQVRLAENHGAW